MRLEELKGRPGVTVHTSHIPGDVVIQLALDDPFPLCIVGLNSAGCNTATPTSKESSRFLPASFKQFCHMPEFRTLWISSSGIAERADVAPSSFMVVAGSTEHILLRDILAESL